MPEGYRESDSDLIHSAYAEKVKEAFKVFAENLSMGQGEKNVRERFLRSLEMVRKARDLALDAMSDTTAEPEPTQAAATRPEPAAGLTSEEQAIIEQALAGTTNQRPAPTRR